MQALKWWDWPVDKIQEFLPYLMNGDLEKIVAMKNR
jgi:virginiamycin A acetyltransferase